MKEWVVIEKMGGDGVGVSDERKENKIWNI